MKKYMIKYRKRLIIAGILFIAAVFACLSFYIGAETVGNGNEEAFHISPKQLEIESCSLTGRSGISQGEPLEFVFNQLISPNVTNFITISPAIEGKWTTIDNRLLFTPKSRWSPGTYYKVNFSNQRAIGDMGKNLKEPRSFSFETQDSSLRIPGGASFVADQRQYFFSPEEEINLFATYNDMERNADTTVTVKVWQFEDSKSFVDGFSPLFQYPQWASLSRAKTIVDTGGLKYLGKSDVPLRDGELLYHSMPKGQYLFRLVVGGAAVDMAVTVDDTDVFHQYDGKYLYVWNHQDGVAEEKATVTIGNVSGVTDTLGAVALKSDVSLEERYQNPENFVLEIVNKEETQVIFLEEQDVVPPSYDGTLQLSQNYLTAETSLSFGGKLFAPKTIPLPIKTVDVTIGNDKGILYQEEVELDGDLSFQGQFKELSLAKGTYNVILAAEDTVIDEKILHVAQEDSFGKLMVSQSSNALYHGDEIVFKVKAVNTEGVPFKNKEITLVNRNETAMTNQEGEATFYFEAAIAPSIPFIDKEVVFQCALDKKRKITATASYTVVNVGETSVVGKETFSYRVRDGALEVNRTSQEMVQESSTPVEIPAKEDFCYFNTEGKSFAMSKTKTEETAFAIGYAEGNYRYDSMALPLMPLSLTVPEALEIKAGETANISLGLEGFASPYIIAEVYKGSLPGGFYGKSQKGTFGDSSEKTLALMSYYGKDNNVAFSTQGLYGDYYIKVQAINEDRRSVTRYIPMAVQEGGTILSHVKSGYPQGEEITFFLGTEGKDLSYQVRINDQVVTVGNLFDSQRISLGTLNVGSYQGRIDLLNNDTVVAKENFFFMVYQKEPAFLGVSEKPRENAMATYKVNPEKKEHFKELFKMNLQPGDQMMQILSRNMLIEALGEDAGFFATHLQKDFSGMQNNDGSFSRFPGGEGDMLLSCFVALNQDAIYNREMLSAFFRNKMSTTEDIEMLALSYWGLSLLGDAPLENMVYHVGDNRFNNKAKLYLAEAFYIAKDETNAKNIYRDLSRSLKEDNGALFFSNPQDQSSIFEALLMLDLAQKLNQNHVDGLLSYLMNTELTTQSNRYLMTLNLVQYLDMGNITLSNGAIKKEELLTIGGIEPKTSIHFKGEYTLNQEKIKEATVGDTVRLSVKWDSQFDKNNLYMLYFTPNQDITLLKDAATLMNHGHAMMLTMKDQGSLYFTLNQPGSNVIGDIYVLNVTTGKVLGKVDIDNLVVK